MKKLMFLFLLVVVAFALGVRTVQAANYLAVTIEAPSTIDISDADPFTASGPAVEAGLLCAAGDVSELSISVRDIAGGRYRMIRVVKHFLCADGSGTFDIRLRARLDLATLETHGKWQIAGGTGDYASLRGTGTQMGIPLELGVSTLDRYHGRLH